MNLARNHEGHESSTTEQDVDMLFLGARQSRRYRARIGPGCTIEALALHREQAIAQDGAILFALLECAPTRPKRFIEMPRCDGRTVEA